VAEETEFAMGAGASCADGPGGRVIRVIIDPATEAVTHLVIEPGHWPAGARLVPLDLVETTSDGIRLRRPPGDPRAAGRSTSSPERPSLLAAERGLVLLGDW
jgi:hypothetical protein